jgi:uncharacterized membrane protein
MTPYEEAAKNNALIAYILMCLGAFTGLFWLAGAIWAMLKKADAKGTIFADHYSNITKTFWWGLGFSLLGFVLIFVAVGYLVLLAVWVWSVFRIVKGLVQITSNKSYSGK